MKKKTINIRGKLLEDLAQGSPARIAEANGGIRVTSLVEHYFIHPSGSITIDTANTRYVLRPASSNL